MMMMCWMMNGKIMNCALASMHTAELYIAPVKQKKGHCQAPYSGGELSTSPPKG